MDDDLGAISWDNDRNVNYLSTTKLDIGIATFEFVLQGPNSVNGTFNWNFDF